MGRVSPATFLLELDKLYAKQKEKGSVYVEMKRSAHCLLLLLDISFNCENPPDCERAATIARVQQTFVVDYGTRSILNSRCDLVFFTLHKAELLGCKFSAGCWIRTLTGTGQPLRKSHTLIQR